MKNFAHLILVFIFLVIGTSCKKEKDEELETLSGTVWISSRVDNKEGELHFLSED